jgi:CBS domain-containing protein
VDTPLAEVCRLMVTEGISSLVVVDQDGYLQGLLSTTDLLRAHLAHDDWRLHPAGEVMSTDVVCVNPSSLLREVAELLVTNRIHRVVVVQMEEGKPRPVAVVSSSDLAYHMVKEL